MYYATDRDEDFRATLHSAEECFVTWVHYSPTGKVSAGEQTAVLPGELALDQNYPNPFNPQTHIRLHLATDAVVTIVVYDMLGQAVRTIAQGEAMGAGEHRLPWDGRDDSGKSVASGVYVCRAMYGDRVASSRMTLLR